MPDPASKNVRTKAYKKLFAELSPSVKELADATFAKFKVDPYAPALHNHSLHDCRKSPHRDGTRAVSINYHYRALYVVEGDTNVWYWVGSHSDYNIYCGGK